MTNQAPKHHISYHTSGRQGASCIDQPAVPIKYIGSSFVWCTSGYTMSYTKQAWKIYSSEEGDLWWCEQHEMIILGFQLTN